MSELKNDTKKDFEWLLKAAEQGHVEAENNLASLCNIELLER